MNLPERMQQCYVCHRLAIADDFSCCAEEISSFSKKEKRKEISLFSLVHCQTLVHQDRYRNGEVGEAPGNQGSADLARQVLGNVLVTLRRPLDLAQRCETSSLQPLPATPSFLRLWCCSSQQLQQRCHEGTILAQSQVWPTQPGYGSGIHLAVPTRGEIWTHQH